MRAAFRVARVGSAPMAISNREHQLRALNFDTYFRFFIVKTSSDSVRFTFWTCDSICGFRNFLMHPCNDNFQCCEEIVAKNEDSKRKTEKFLNLRKSYQFKGSLTYVTRVPSVEHDLVVLFHCADESRAE